MAAVIGGPHTTTLSARSKILVEDTQEEALCVHEVEPGSSEETDENTLLSYPDSRSEWDSVEDDDDEAASTSNLNDEMEEQEELFQYRDQVLRRIASKFEKDPSVYDFLWKRELQVRKLERENLLLRRVHAEDKEDLLKEETAISSKNLEDVAVTSTVHRTAHTNDMVRHGRDVFFDASMEDLNPHTTSPQLPENDRNKRKSDWMSWFLFDCKMAGGTFLNILLILQSNLSMEEAMQELSQRLPPSWQTPEEGAIVAETPCLMLNAARLLVSFVVLRCTVTLYWFASPADYDCVKYDLHNAVRLGEPMAHLLNVMSLQHGKLSFLLYLWSLTIVSNALHFWNEYFYMMFFGGEGTALHWILCYDVIAISLCFHLLTQRGYEF